MGAMYYFYARIHNTTICKFAYPAVNLLFGPGINDRSRVTQSIEIDPYPTWGMHRLKAMRFPANPPGT